MYQMVHMSLYTDQDLAFIKEHLPKMGATWCAKRLKRHPESLRKKGKEIGVTCNKPHRADEDRNVNPQYLYDIKLPEVAYFLGYFWADGNIHTYRTKKGTSTHHRVAIEIEKNDGEHLRRIAETFGRWSVVERSRKRYEIQCKPVLGLIINNEPVHDFLRDHGYDDKSLVSPDLILAKIPDHLKPAFWLGFFDGDGSITVQISSNLKRGRAVVQFAGSYEQDWHAAQEMWKGIGVSVEPYRSRSRLGHGKGAITVQNQAGVKAFYQYIKPFARLGLPRKQAKFERFIQWLEG